MKIKNFEFNILYKYWPLGFISLFLIPAIWFLLLPGFFETDDGEWMVIRFSAFYQALRDGQFPVRFLGRLNYGYGYPVANFLYPGFMYAAVPFHILGLSFLNSLKTVLILSMLGSGIFSYLWLSKLFDKISSFFGALYLVYAPYHIFDLYKRGSVGEIVAISILPFIFWQIERKSSFWTIGGIAFLIISHNTLAFLFLLLIISYLLLNVLISSNKQRLSFQYIYILVLSLGLSSFFWVPAIFDLQYTVFSKTHVSNWSKYFSDVNLIGISTIIIFLAMILLFIRKKENLSKHRLTFLLFTIGFISILLSLPISFFLWKSLPVSFIQFPFRMLSVVIICFSFLLAFILSNLSPKLKIAFGCLIILLTIMNARPFFQIKLKNIPDSIYATNEATTTVQDEYMPKWVREKPSERYKNKVEIVEGNGEVKNLIYNDSKKISFDFKSNVNSKIRVNTIYYPGWKAKVNNRESVISYNDSKGVIELMFTTGENKVEVVFEETSIRTAANIISIISFGILSIIAFRARRRNV